MLVTGTSAVGIRYSGLGVGAQDLEQIFLELRQLPGARAGWRR
jgi:hypothetical protein